MAQTISAVAGETTSPSMVLTLGDKIEFTATSTASLQMCESAYLAGISSTTWDTALSASGAVYATKDGSVFRIVCTSGTATAVQTDVSSDDFLTAIYDNGGLYATAGSALTPEQAAALAASGIMTPGGSAAFAEGGYGSAVVDYGPSGGVGTLSFEGTDGGLRTGYVTITNIAGGYPSTRAEVLYVNSSGSDVTLVPSIGFSGVSVVLYQSGSTSAGSNIIIDASGNGSSLYLNGILQPATTMTLYSGDTFEHWYILVSSEDGDSYAVFETGRQLHKQQFVPTNGSTNTCSDCIGFAVMKPAGTIAGATLVYPPHPQDGDEFVFTSTQIITTLTNSSGANSRVGAPTTLTANAYATMKYSLSDTTWYRNG